MQMIYIYQIDLIEKLSQAVQLIQWACRRDYEILVTRYGKTVCTTSRGWFSFCSENGLQPLNEGVTSGAEFLTQYFRRPSCE